MAQKPNKPSLMRIVIPLLAALVGVLVILSLMQPPEEDAGDQADANTPAAQGDPDAPDKDKPADKQAKPKPGADEQADPEDPDAEAVAEAPIEAEVEAGTEDAEAEPQTPEATGPLTNLEAVFAEPTDLITLGSDAEDAGYALVAQINPYRSCIHSVTINGKYKRVDKEEPYSLLQPINLSPASDPDKYPTIGSYAAQRLLINGEPVPMARLDKETNTWAGHWAIESKKTDELTLSLTIQGGPDDQRADVVKITRTYRLSPGSHTLDLKQNITNLTDQPLTLQWEQLAQGDVFHEKNDYLRGRSLHYVTGYFDDDYDQARFSIYVEDGFITRPDLIGKLKDPEDTGKWASVWPNPQVDKQDKQLAWLASENRYFVAISSADVDPEIEETAELTALESVYPTITTTIYPNALTDPNMADDDRAVLIGLASKALTVKPGATTAASDLSLDLFVGPREGDLFAQAPYKAMRFDKTIRYSLGGFCGVCTFQWLANLLLGFLELLHAVVFDWGVAIIILVIVVRLCLHPLTKRGQISMMTMGKQMAAVQPEMEKLKKKFADDPRQMQQAQMQLFREKGINPAAGALGCLPMLLQMPIWIALYAMLYYAIELRHEPAFYGVFQAMGNWPFLADLSSADRFIPLFANDGQHVVNLLFIRFDYSSINILPLLMGITFFINMKFTTPPPMNEQQATQQKIMRIMPLLFPIFLYSAPAGLTLYISASTMAGIVDSYIVRKHVKEMEESGELFKPKKRKPGGFMDRLQKAAEVRAQQMEELKKQQGQGKGGQNYKKKRKR